jgi:hypothetical protein
VAGITFVIGPRVAVRPLHKLLVDPSEEADRAVGEAVAERLRSGCLLVPIAPAPSRKVFPPCEARFLSRRVRRQGVLKGG